MVTLTLIGGPGSAMENLIEYGLGLCIRGCGCVRFLFIDILYIRVCVCVQS